MAIFATPMIPFCIFATKLKNREIMKPTLRVLFDRKNTATESVPALVQIEIYFQGKRKYISTGVKVRSNEWDYTRSRVVGSSNDFNSNYRISSLLQKLDDYLIDCDRRGEDFSFSSIDTFICGNTMSGMRFPEYVLSKIDKRKITDSTRRKLMSLFSHIQKFGRFKTFADLTQSNIKEFDYYLSQSGISDTSVYERHKQMKSFINEAISDGYLKNSPYVGIKLQKGKTKDPIFLLEDEIELIKKFKTADEKIEKVRDLYVFQCFTGLSYSDLADFTRDDVRVVGDKKIISSSRKKTDESYITLLLPDAEKILEKYDYILPIISNQKYNDYLKVLSSHVGINKRLTTHTARHTYATYLLNRGISIEVVSRTLGHSKITQTQHYAKLLGKTVIDEMSSLL